MQSSVRYLQDLVRSGGPESDQYETLNQTFVDFNQLARQGEFDHYGPDFKEDLMGTSFGYDTMQGYVYRQPHGHSGDFELYERIYGNYQTPNKDLEKWDQFWNKQAFVSALQNSQRYFNQTLADTEASSTNTNVLNVASGSSRFVADYLKLNQSATTFHCMDQSHRALDYARLLCRGHLHQVQFQQGQVAELAQDIRYDLVWSEGPNGTVTYGDVFHQNEVEMSEYNFDHADVDSLFVNFDTYERESARMIEAGLPLPAYELVLKASHTFNLLDARKAISVTERQRFILRVRTLARSVAQAYYERRESLGFPMLASANKEAKS